MNMNEKTSNSQNSFEKKSKDEWIMIPDFSIYF